MNITLEIDREIRLIRTLTQCTAALKATTAERDALTQERDTYQVAADKLAAENKVLRDALETCINFGSGSSFNEQAYLPPQVLDDARVALTRSKS